MQRFSRVISPVAMALLIGTALAACSDYLDRRDTLALSSGDAVASDTVTQMVDPWPAASADKNIAFNGQKMQSAVQRYRENKVTAPVGTDTSDAYAPPPPAQAASTTSPSPVGPTVTQSPN
jgi:hypothetical protein